MCALPALHTPTPSCKRLASPDGMRLRLLTLFALYDVLPHSIANSPDGDSPMDLDSAIEATVVQTCLQSMEEQGRLSVGEAKALVATYAPTGVAVSRPRVYFFRTPGSSSVVFQVKNPKRDVS